jgi:DNA repair exonuclease SbcCD ATPase subunit
MKARTNLTIDKDIYERFKQKVPNMSEEVEAFMSRRIVELSGSDERARRLRYEELKSQYNKLVKKVAEKDQELREITPHYHTANELLHGLGLKADFSNAEELIPKVTKEWTGPVEFLHEYINLVELARDKRVVERELTQLRSQGTSEPVCTAIVPVEN